MRAYLDTPNTGARLSLKDTRGLNRLGADA